ncbi:hypothetical protein B0H13DRAFT_2343181 [Mycena leptocephala]|nr:hypothetical protein B0H13DRAFT_2343181 [Mycena leptocephala]
MSSLAIPHPRALARTPSSNNARRTAPSGLADSDLASLMPYHAQTLNITHAHHTSTTRSRRTPLIVLQHFLSTHRSPSLRASGRLLPRRRRRPLYRPAEPGEEPGVGCVEGCAVGCVSCFEFYSFYTAFGVNAVGWLAGWWRGVDGVDVGAGWILAWRGCRVAGVGARCVSEELRRDAYPGGLLFAAGVFVLLAPGGSLDTGVLRVGLCVPFGLDWTGLDLLLAYPFRFPFYIAMTSVGAIVPLRVGESAA